MNFDEITSRQNPLVGYVSKLSEKKYRDRERKFRIDGVKLFGEAVSFGLEIECVLVTKNAFERLAPTLEDLSGRTEIRLLSDSVFQKLSEEKSPEGVICVAKHIDKLHKIATIDNRDGKDRLGIAANESIFALESVRDPGNLGTVIRTAAAFGVDVLLMSRDCADIYNPKTMRAAMGALFHQRILTVDDLPTAIEELKTQGRRFYAATLGKDAGLLGKFELEHGDCIVVGNEGHGLSRETVSSCGNKILIPMVEGTESLNAAVAASVCLWEQFGRNI